MFLNPAQGAGLIAAGAGAKLLAGLLGGGGSSGAPTPTGSVVDPVNTTESDLTSPETLEQSQPNTQVQLIVQGDVLDNQETGTRLLNVLNESFDKQAGYFTNARTV